MITLYGATGYTGNLIAAVLEREGLPYRLAGRSEPRLSALSQALPSHPSWVCADAIQPPSLPALFKNTNLIINCAGPFTDLGERVLSMAAVSGVHYLDTTNELGFVYQAQTYHSLARKTKAILSPACAFEVAISDCAAALLARENPGPYQKIDVIYHLTGSGASRGTRMSALRSLATSWIGYRDGGWKGEAPGSCRQWFQLQAGRQAALSFPSSESVTLPNHLPVRRVQTWMTGVLLASVFSPFLVPVFARFLRSFPGRSVLWAAALGGSSPTIRTRDPFEILVRLESEKKVSAASLTGSGVYEMTAEIIVYAAKQILSTPPTTAGVVPPARLFDPAGLISAGTSWGLVWHAHPDEVVNA